MSKNKGTEPPKEADEKNKKGADAQKSQSPRAPEAQAETRRAKHAQAGDGNLENGNAGAESAKDAALAMEAGENAAALAEISARLAAALETAEKNRDLYLRAAADLDTYRRKARRENEELAKFALQPFVEELLPSLDHLEMAIEASKAAADAKSLIEGVEMVGAQIKKLLEKHGVEEVKTQGLQFDPNCADCVRHEPSETVPENTVLKVARRGYTYNGRLIRPASVVVSSGKGK